MPVRGTVSPRTKASALWGLVGALSFLVLLQGYELASGHRYALAVKAGVAVVVTIGAATASYVGNAVAAPSDDSPEE